MSEVNLKSFINPDVVGQADPLLGPQQPGDQPVNAQGIGVAPPGSDAAKFTEALRNHPLFTGIDDDISAMLSQARDNGVRLTPDQVNRAVSSCLHGGISINMADMLTQQKVLSPAEVLKFSEFVARLGLKPQDVTEASLPDLLKRFVKEDMAPRRQEEFMQMRNPPADPQRAEKMNTLLRRICHEQDGGNFLNFHAGVFLSQGLAGFEQKLSESFGNEHQGMAEVLMKLSDESLNRLMKLPSNELLTTIVGLTMAMAQYELPDDAINSMVYEMNADLRNFREVVTNHVIRQGIIGNRPEEPQQADAPQQGGAPRGTLKALSSNPEIQAQVQLLMGKQAKNGLVMINGDQLKDLTQKAIANYLSGHMQLITDYAQLLADRSGEVKALLKDSGQQEKFLNVLLVLDQLVVAARSGLPLADFAAQLEKCLQDMDDGLKQKVLGLAFDMVCARQHLDAGTQKEAIASAMGALAMEFRVLAGAQPAEEADPVAHEDAKSHCRRIETTAFALFRALGGQVPAQNAHLPGLDAVSVHSRMYAVKLGLGIETGADLLMTHDLPNGKQDSEFTRLFKEIRDEPEFAGIKPENLNTRAFTMKNPHFAGRVVEEIRKAGAELSPENIEAFKRTVFRSELEEYVRTVKGIADVILMNDTTRRMAENRRAGDMLSRYDSVFKAMQGVGCIRTSVIRSALLLAAGEAWFSGCLALANAAQPMSAEQVLNVLREMATAAQMHLNTLLSEDERAEFTSVLLRVAVRMVLSNLSDMERQKLTTMLSSDEAAEMRGFLELMAMRQADTRAEKQLTGSMGSQLRLMCVLMDEMAQALGVPLKVQPATDTAFIRRMDPQALLFLCRGADAPLKLAALLMAAKDPPTAAAALEELQHILDSLFPEGVIHNDAASQLLLLALMNVVDSLTDLKAFRDDEPRYVQELLRRLGCVRKLPPGLSFKSVAAEFLADIGAQIAALGHGSAMSPAARLEAALRVGMTPARAVELMRTQRPAELKDVNPSALVPPADSQPWPAGIVQTGADLANGGHRVTVTDENGTDVSISTAQIRSSHPDWPQKPVPDTGQLHAVSLALQERCAGGETQLRAVNGLLSGNAVHGLKLLPALTGLPPEQCGQIPLDFAISSREDGTVHVVVQAQPGYGVDLHIGYHVSVTGQVTADSFRLGAV